MIFYLESLYDLVWSSFIMTNKVILIMNDFDKNIDNNVLLLTTSFDEE